MKRSFAFLIPAIISLCVACSAPKNTINSSERDGSSYAKAIIINEEHERPGIDAEYAWIRKQYPGSKSHGQALMYHDKTPYDVMHVLTSDGKEIDVYFDISKFFGKF